MDNVENITNEYDLTEATSKENLEDFTKLYKEILKGKIK
jgi:hypothetical protein